jgi:hypothetical protein
MLDAMVGLDDFRASNSLTPAQLLTIADINSDTTVTNSDIQAMLNLLTGGGGVAEIRSLALGVFDGAHYLGDYTTAVPEPAGLSLIALAGVTLVCRRR